MLTLALPVYINLQLLIPKFLRNNKYTLYLLTLLLTLAFGVLFNWYLFSKSIDLLLPGYYFISYYTLWDLAKFFLAFLALSTLLKLSKEWFQLSEAKRELSELEKEKTAIELKALRAQINPHFLFNSLHVLYTLALNSSKETPEAIIKLSDLLRYVIYDANKNVVKLSDEIEQINNYLDLQSYRIEDSSDITFEKKIVKNALIPPLILIPLVENSFKHGIKGALAKTFIHMYLSANDERLTFQIENNKSDNETSTEDEDHGIGLENIQNRLVLLYPEKHTFQITENEHTFKVSLEISYED